MCACVCACVRACTAVCVHLGWVKCRAQIPSMAYHTWPRVTSLSLSFFIFTNRQCALVALEDVMTYLNEEGGQIAVRNYLFTVLQLLTFVVFIFFYFFI